MFGLAPALSASADTRRWNRPRSVFVVAEVALTFILLVGAGLLLRSFVALGRVDPGFNPHGVLTMNTSLTYAKLTGARRYAAFYGRFVDNLARLPGVSAAGATSNLPLSGGENSVMFGIQGRPRAANGFLHAHYIAVSPDYLKTIGVPLLAGRWLTVADHFDAPKVVLLNRAMALRYWPNEKACLGQQINVMRDLNTVDSTLTIVGVVGDVRDALTEPDVEAMMYQPFLQTPSFGNYVVVRSNVDRGALIAAVRQAAQQMGNDLSIQEIRSLDQVVAGAAATQRFALQTIGSFAVIALALALIGIYGVTSYAASRRAKEIAIRSALGARPADTIALLLREGVRSIAIALVIGGLAAVALTRLMANILYGVSATDPLTFALTAVTIAVVATAACLLPASKALAIDPMEMLRRE
jgi:putative ABC transport system permease protein